MKGDTAGSSSLSGETGQPQGQEGHSRAGCLKEHWEEGPPGWEARGGR